MTTLTTPTREPQAPASQPGARVATTIGWVLVAIGLAATLLMPLAGLGGGSVICLFLTVIFAAVHGTRRYGWPRYLTFFAVTFVVSNAYENLSIMTGFPFGHYHYTGGPKLFYVPVMVGLLYCGLGYISWMTTSTLLDRADERLNWRERTGRVNTVALPAIAASVMTMFDVATDAQASTIGHTWIWENGGGVFGVPYTNYLGWWLVTYTFFQIFALLLSRAQTQAANPGAAVTPGSLLQPVLLYAATGLATISTFFTTKPGTTIDATGVTWSLTAINETAMTISIFTVITVAALALAKIARGDTHTPR